MIGFAILVRSGTLAFGDKDKDRLGIQAAFVARGIEHELAEVGLQARKDEYFRLKLEKVDNPDWECAAHYAAMVQYIREHEYAGKSWPDSALQSFIDAKKKLAPADWQAKIGTYGGANMVQVCSTLEEVAELVNALPYVCCNCWNEHTPTEEDELTGRSIINVKHEMYIRHVKKVGCQVPDCPFGRNSLWFNLHHAEGHCTGETKRMINSGATVAQMKKYLARRDLMVMCEFCHRRTHTYEERDGPRGNKGLIYGGKDLPDLRSPDPFVWRCVTCNQINSDSDRACNNCTKPNFTNWIRKLCS